MCCLKIGLMKFSGFYVNAFKYSIFFFTLLKYLIQWFSVHSQLQNITIMQYCTFFPLGFLGFIHPEFYLICLTITNIF